MANLTGFYDPSAEIPTGGGALPAGWYFAQIIESELRDNYNKDGEEYQFTYEVMDGDHKGRKFWHSIARSGPDTSRIGKGQGEINAITAACGIKGAPNDTQDFHYKPHWVRLSFVAAGTSSKSGNTYQKDRNFLNEWKPANDGMAPTQDSPQPATSASSTPPWVAKSA
ncbi:hypothetical protein CSC70_03950 [Pseudoxanthomonas kalamensis DSM 18571]|uniref:DUF669 domain-containing protein n=1 Tax=Pseudoxanthomonas kalamensis TaxID=289483 RepID=UPI001390CE0C|nr:DUF669 domain-containing protein [Pseudoxanthomonas kalamensis]KAF1711089.1 hypothetical protein CSC70_03950 [Pseudoxanthomonas kalamensis DSM 18571]